jgi:hypothetical protein
LAIYAFDLLASRFLKNPCRAILNMATQPKTGLPRFYSVANAGARHMIDENETQKREEIPRLSTTASPQKGDEAHSENAPSSVTKPAPVSVKVGAEQPNRLQLVAAKISGAAGRMRLGGVMVFLALAAICATLWATTPAATEMGAYNRIWFVLGGWLCLWLAFIRATKPTDMGDLCIEDGMSYCTMLVVAGVLIPSLCLTAFALYQLPFSGNPVDLITGVVENLMLGSWVASYWVKEDRRLRASLQTFPTLLALMTAIYVNLMPGSKSPNPIGIIVLWGIIWGALSSFMNQREGDFWEPENWKKTPQAPPRQTTVAHADFADKNQGDLTGLEER